MARTPGAAISVVVPKKSSCRSDTGVVVLNSMLIISSIVKSTGPPSNDVYSKKSGAPTAEAGG